jgi:hypothetical protein
LVNTGSLNPALNGNSAARDFRASEQRWLPSEARGAAQQAKKMSDKELQRALLKERRAAEKCERLKVQCRSQANLMTRLFASKLGEQGELLSEALDRGASSELGGRAAAFRESTAWILGEIEAGGIDGASDAELDALRAENAALVDARDELERRYVEGGTTLTAPEPSHAEQRIRDLEDELDAARDDARAAKARARELEQARGRPAGGGGGSSNADGEEVAALRREVAALRGAGDAGVALAELSEAMERLKADHKEALKKAKAKARAADGDAVKNAEKEKEQLMSAMEKEVEALIAEERAKFDKERERLEKSAAKAKKSAKGNTKALSALAKQVRALKPQIASARREARATLAELPAVSKDVAAQILSRVRSTERELAETTRKYKRELGERKRLHNLVRDGVRRFDSQAASENQKFLRPRRPPNASVLARFPSPRPRDRGLRARRRCPRNARRRRSRSSGATSASSAACARCRSASASTRARTWRPA